MIRNTTCLFFLILGSNLSWGQSPSVVMKNNLAAKYLTEGKTAPALEELSGALIEDPRRSELHYNLGLTFDFEKDGDKAIQEFKSVGETAIDLNLKFSAYFNAAVVATQQKKTDLALAFYQKALEFNPSSKEVKTNIELLLKDSQGGGGENDKDPSKDSKDSKGQDPKEEKKDGKGEQNEKKESETPKDSPNPKPKPKPKPKEFKSEELSQRDVKNILEELKRQEEQIRARLNDQRTKEKSNDKDW